MADAAIDLDALTDDAFRMHVRGWIQDNYPPELRNPPRSTPILGAPCPCYRAVLWTSSAALF